MKEPGLREAAREGDGKMGPCFSECGVGSESFEHHQGAHYKERILGPTQDPLKESGLWLNKALGQFLQRFQSEKQYSRAEAEILRNNACRAGVWSPDSWSHKC